MSRAVVIASVLLVALAGCVTEPQVPLEQPVEAQPCSRTQLQEWLELERKVSRMSDKKVEKELNKLDSPVGRRQLFYFGLLIQQRDDFESWAEARDAFRQLSDDTGLAREQRNLVVILQRYNQTRINWYLQYRQALENHGTVKAKLRASQEETERLEQKLQAITDLETSISTRKEQ